MSRPVTNIEDVYPEWERRFNAADLRGLLDLYADDATFVNPQGKPVSGLGAMSADFEGMAAMHARIEIYERQHLVYGDTCLTTNRWRMVLKSADGKPQELHGGGIEVLRRQADAGWRFIIDDASRIAVPADGQAPGAAGGK